MNPGTGRATATPFDGLVAQWLGRLRSPNTRAAYEADMRAFAAWCGVRGRSPMAATRSDLVRYSAECRGAGASPATVARRLSAVSSFYTHGVAVGAVADNPVKGIERPATTGRDLEPVLDGQETDALLEAASDLGPKVEALVGLLLLDGLKLGEALALDVGDLIRTARGATASVRRQGGRQRVPLHPRTSKAIGGYLAGRKAGPLLLGSSPTRVTTARLTRFGADFLLKQASSRAGLARKASASLLRSSYISAAHRRGSPIEHIRHHVGHRHARDTRRYVG